MKDIRLIYNVQAHSAIVSETVVKAVSPWVISKASSSSSVNSLISPMLLLVATRPSMSPGLSTVSGRDDDRNLDTGRL